MSYTIEQKKKFWQWWFIVVVSIFIGIPLALGILGKLVEWYGS